MTETLTGGCQCGAVRYRVTGEPEVVALCHCRMCQKATGSIAWAFFTVRRADLEWTRGALAHFRSSAAATRGYCASCGTPLSFEADGEVEHLWISGVHLESDGYHGVLQNEPQVISRLKMGDAVVIPRDRVSDWFAIEDGHLVAGYTMHIFHDRMPPEERKHFDETAGFTIDD